MRRKLIDLSIVIAGLVEPEEFVVRYGVAQGCRKGHRPKSRVVRQLGQIRSSYCFVKSMNFPFQSNELAVLS
jgi:hypothetical protein